MDKKKKKKDFDVFLIEDIAKININNAFLDYNLLSDKRSDKINTNDKNWKDLFF